LRFSLAELSLQYDDGSAPMYSAFTGDSRNIFSTYPLSMIYNIFYTGRILE